MSGKVLGIAMDDFNIDPEIYGQMKRLDLIKMTNAMIDCDEDDDSKDILSTSQQILLNGKKKSVSFDSLIVVKEKVHKKKKKKKNENIPILEFLEVCIQKNNEPKHKLHKIF